MPKVAFLYIFKYVDMKINGNITKKKDNKGLLFLNMRKRYIVMNYTVREKHAVVTIGHIHL